MRGWTTASGERGRARSVRNRRAVALWLTAIGFVTLAGLMVGCTSSRGAGTGDETGHKVESDSGDATRGKIGRAERMAEDGDYAAALDTLTTALRTSEDRYRDRIQEMRLALKRRALAEVLEARVRVADDRVIVGRPLVVTLELVNRGNQTVTVPRVDYRSRLVLFRKEIGRTQIDLRFEVQDYDATGEGRWERFNRYEEPADDIEVAPGRTWSQTITLASDQLRPETEFSARLSARLLRRLRIAVILRPVQLLLGERDFYTSIHFEPAVVYLLPRGSEPIFEDPYHHLELALLRSAREARFVPNILVAASLIPEAKRDEACALLTQWHETGEPALRPVAGQALALFWPEAAKPTKAPEAEMTFKPIDG